MSHDKEMCLKYQGGCGGLGIKRFVEEDSCCVLLLKR